MNKMKLQKLLFLAALGVQLAVPVHGLAQSREVSGNVSKVTSKALVLDGLTYQFQYNSLEERRPKPTEQCVVSPKKQFCEELYETGQKFKARLTLNGAGRVIKVEILGELK